MNACRLCNGTGMIWPVNAPCTCDPDPLGRHWPYCGGEPCPRGCDIPPEDPPPDRRRGIEDVDTGLV